MTGVTTTAFSAVLVANRGEIARRVFRTARAMGLRCVAVYTDADAGEPFVGEADEAVRLTTGYLDGAAIVAAAAASGAGAVHPGYGFLSENAAFARDVEAAGLVWVGPSPAVIEAMGDKLAAKRAAVDAGVPTLPMGDEAGFPLVVKPSAGGGGKGMRVVARAADLPEAMASARREAAAAFGDDTVFVERFVARSRHIEIQILGDAHGLLVHLGERECSIQRRHQKIVEESPSPVVDDAMRTALGEAALRLAAAIGYQSAGTVEFLVDDASREFYFLEVNTRLQVEHPVTEEITGLDLVREQLRIAAGEPLGWSQADITFTGHAIEARLYAEDPGADFLPAAGPVTVFEPAAEPAVRWDSGVESGSVVGVAYDPLLAKVVAVAPTRAEAAGRLALALERLHLGGLTTNRDFLSATLRHPAFLAGDTTTDFVERHDPARSLAVDPIELQSAAVAAALWLQGANRNKTAVLAAVPSGWRNARLPAQRVLFAHGDQPIAIEYRFRRDGAFAVGDGSARVHRWAPGLIDVEINGRRRAHRVTRAADRLYVQANRGTVELRVVPRFIGPHVAGPTGGFVAPMPGVVLDVRCVAGDDVVAGQTLVVLEAMKMEHHMKAPAAGRVAEVRTAVGDQVVTGAVLVVFEDAAAAAPMSADGAP